MVYKYTPPQRRPVRETQRAIINELRKWDDQLGIDGAVGESDFIVSPKIGGNAAVFRLVLRGLPVEFRCDKYDRYDVNLRCVYLAVQSMRLNEARGIGETMRDAYLQLAVPERHRDPYEVLGIRSDAPLAVAEAAWKVMIADNHPDRGGDPGRAKEINAAIERIREERR
mgnify:CR=1 FL=1